MSRKDFLKFWFYKMKQKENLDLVEKYIKNLSNNEDEKNELYIFISQN